ncbi:MAG: hypothetical protein HBSAPP03_25430 [Phycisphaerae bacterium]|nr:MAG: hypothetical protein HBSAPP03_25430 [Phycisphaerae bacterium]
MPIEVREKFESRRLVKAANGTNSSAELAYIVLGTDNDIAARDALEAEAPVNYATLPRQSVQIEPLGPGLWDGVARYALSGGGGGGGLPTGESSFQFDTGGGTQHITQSRATVQRVPAPGMVAPDFQGAIGVSADGVEGIDITVPVYTFAETHYKPDSAITGAYKGVLFSLTGKVNGDGFRGFAPGEVLFLGASGAKRGSGTEADWEITYRFAASPNASGLSIGPIGGITKQGWDYLWVRYSDQEDTAAKALVKRPIAAYVERVYESGSFAALQLG